MTDKPRTTTRDPGGPACAIGAFPDHRKGETDHDPARALCRGADRDAGPAALYTFPRRHPHTSDDGRGAQRAVRCGLGDGAWPCSALISFVHPPYEGHLCHSEIRVAHLTAQSGRYDLRSWRRVQCRSARAHCIHANVAVLEVCHINTIAQRRVAAEDVSNLV